MKCWILLILTAAFASLAYAAEPKCDCTMFPWKKECDQKCGIASGKVRSLENGKLTLDVPSSGGIGMTTQKFSLDEHSLNVNSPIKKSDLKTDTSVTVLFQKESNGSKTVKSVGAASTDAAH